MNCISINFRTGSTIYSYRPKSVVYTMKFPATIKLFKVSHLISSFRITLIGTNLSEKQRMIPLIQYCLFLSFFFIKNTDINRFGLKNNKLISHRFFYAKVVSKYYYYFRPNNNQFMHELCYF